jgi:hypothetical protein
VDSSEANEVLRLVSNIGIFHIEHIKNTEKEGWATYNVRLFRTGTMNPPLYKEYIPIKMKKNTEKVSQLGKQKAKTVSISRWRGWLSE